MQLADREIGRNFSVPLSCHSILLKLFPLWVSQVDMPPHSRPKTRGFRVHLNTEAAFNPILFFLKLSWFLQPTSTPITQAGKGFHFTYGEKVFFMSKPLSFLLFICSAVTSSCFALYDVKIQLSEFLGNTCYTLMLGTSQGLANSGPCCFYMAEGR